MSECIECNVCDSPGTVEESPEIQRIACHVECFKNDCFTVWRCANCGSLHSKEEVDLPHYYDRYPFKNHRLDLHTKVGYANRIRLMKKNGLRKDHRILDFGCGKGLFVYFLRDAGYQNVQGYDAFCEEFSDESVLGRTYDVVVSHDVIEHVDDPEAFLRQIADITEPGGMLVIGTPNADEIHLFDTDSPQVELSQPYHRHILSIRALFRLAGRCRLQTVDIYRRFYFDSFVPTVNTKFMWEYIKQTGGMIDVAVEPLKLSIIWKSPKLLFFAFFGYFLPPGGNVLLTFRRLPKTR